MGDIKAKTYLEKLGFADSDNQIAAGSSLWSRSRPAYAGRFYEIIGRASGFHVRSFGEGGRGS